MGADIGAPVGARILLPKVLALGSQDFTLLGRPVLPLDLGRVEATVLEKTLSRTKVVQHFRKRERYRKFKFVRDKWTLLRINSIDIVSKVDQTMDRSGFDDLSSIG